MKAEHTEHADCFMNDLRSRIDYHREENDLDYSQMVGVLELLKQELIMEFVDICSEDIEIEIEDDDEDVWH